MESCGSIRRSVMAGCALFGRTRGGLRSGSLYARCFLVTGGGMAMVLGTRADFLRWGAVILGTLAACVYVYVYVKGLA